MARALRPLTIAAVATVLLVTVLAVDLTYNRTLTLELRQDDGWVPLSSTGEPHDRIGPRALRVDANETLTFRLRVDNDMPFAYEEPYRVYHFGTLVAEGTLTAPASEEGVTTFTLNATALIDDGRGGPPTEQDIHFASLEVEVGDEMLFGSFEIREAGAS